MVRVEVGHRQRIAEDSRCILEGNTMLGKIASGLIGIPLEFHMGIVTFRAALFK